MANLKSRENLEGLRKQFSRKAPKTNNKYFNSFIYDSINYLKQSGMAFLFHDYHVEAIKEKVPGVKISKLSSNSWVATI